MKSVRRVGILGYGAYIPGLRIETSEIGRVWRGGVAGPNREKSVANSDEDATTMAVEAAIRAYEMAGVERLGAVLVGSESKPYAVKPTSTIVAEVLDQHFVLASDLEFACKAGTEAIQFVMGLVGSGMIEAGMAIGVDTAQGRPGDELEYTSACGAAAFVLGDAERSLAEIEASCSYVSDTADFWRRDGERYPMHLHRFTGGPAYFRHIEMAVRALMDELKLGPEDFRYVVFHQPNPRFPTRIAKRLGFDEDRLRPGMLNNEIGNAYSASSLLGFIAVLDEAKPGERILLASFGSGAGSDAFSIVVKDGIKRRGRLRDALKRRRLIDYAIYAKLRGKVG